MDFGEEKAKSGLLIVAGAGKVNLKLLASFCFCGWCWESTNWLQFIDIGWGGENLNDSRCPIFTGAEK